MQCYRDTQTTTNLGKKNKKTGRKRKLKTDFILPGPSKVG